MKIHKKGAYTFLTPETPKEGILIGRVYAGSFSLFIHSELRDGLTLMISTDYYKLFERQVEAIES